MTRGTTAAIAVLLGTIVVAVGQEQTPEPRFTTELELVTVDVSVLGPGGEPVRGLERSDFLIYEDGVPQEVAAFQAVDLPASATPVTLVAPRPRQHISTNAAPTAGRTFVVVFDNLHLTDLQAVEGRRAVERFLQFGVVPGDSVTLVATASDVWWHARLPEGRDDLLRRLRGLTGEYVPDASQERISEWEAYRIDAHQDMDVALRVRRRFESVGAAGLSRLSGSIAREDVARSSLEGIIDPIVRQRAAAVYTEARGRNQATLRLLSRVMESLTGVPGRKGIVLVSRGFVHEAELREMRETVRASLRANAPIYFVDARGLLGMPDAMTGAATAPVDVQDTLTTLTEAERESEGAESIALDTGGFVIEHTNDLGGGLLRVARESAAYYLLAYRPRNLNRDGRFRRIEIHLRERRSAVQINARRGYYARGEERPSRRADGDPVVVAALDSPYAVPNIPLRAAAHAFEETSNGVKVFLTTDVEIGRLSFAERNGRSESTLAFVAEVRSRDTDRRYRYDEKVEMTLQAATRERLGRTGYSISREFVLPPGSYRARIVVRELSRGSLGSVTHEFDVPAPSGLRLSTPVMTDVADGAEPAALRPQLIARRTFGRDSRLYCQYMIYGAASDPRFGPTRVLGGYQIRKASGAVFKEALPTPIVTSSGMLRRLHGISLAGAEPGQYVMTLTVIDEVSGQTVTANEPFTIAGGP